MAALNEFSKLTREQLADIVLKLRSDDVSLRAVNEAGKSRVLALTNKIREMQHELDSGAQRISKYKELQATKDEVDKQNQQLATKVAELEQLNGNIEEAAAILKKKLDDANKRLLAQTAQAQTLLEERAAKKAEMEECSRNKEDIHSKMQSMVYDLNGRIKDYKDGETKKELIIDKLKIAISRLKMDKVGLKTMEQEQRGQMVEMQQQHEVDTKRQLLIEKTLRDQCDQVKATNVLLQERLETAQEALNKFTKLAKPRSPINPKLLTGDNKPGDDKRPGPVKFATIGGGSGRKSPLNPNKLARKIKYRF